MCEKSHVYKFMTWECRMDTPVRRMSVISFWQKPAKELPNDNIRQHIQREEPRPLEIGLMCPYNGFIDRSCVKIILSEAVYFLSGQHYQVNWDKLKQWI